MCKKNIQLEILKRSEMTKKKAPDRSLFYRNKDEKHFVFFFTWPYMFQGSSKLTKQTHLWHFSCIETFGLYYK